MQTASPAPLLTNVSTKAVTLPTPKHWQDRSAWRSVRDDSRHSAVVGRSGRGAPSVVDRGALHHRLGSLRAAGGPDVLGDGRTAGHRAHVPRITVLHLGGIPSVPGGPRRDPPWPAPCWSAHGLARRYWLAGGRSAARRHRLVQLEHWQRAADQPQRSRCGPAGVAPRHVRLRRVPGCQRTGLGGGASRRRRGRPDRTLSRIAVLNLLGSIAFAISAATPYVVPARVRSGTPSFPALAPRWARSASSSARSCSCPPGAADSPRHAPDAFTRRGGGH